MATDPPAASALPEIADLDPAFDLTTFATERSTARPVTAPKPARVQVRPAPDRPVQALFGSAAQTEVVDDLPRGRWLTDSAIQVAVAAVLVFGAIAIVILAVRGRPASRPEPARQVERAPALPAPAASEQAAVPPAPAPRPAKTTARSREPGAAAGRVPASPRRTAAATVSTSGTTARASASRPSLPVAAPSRTPPASAPIVIQHALLNVNARPWANVRLEGSAVGETPLANLRVPVGEHELIFRHPDLGERRVVAVVEPGGPTRVTVDLRE
jgi:hypothetical protein